MVMDIWEFFSYAFLSTEVFLPIMFSELVVGIVKKPQDNSILENAACITFVNCSSSNGRVEK